MVKQIDKAFDDYDKYGIDPDEIMVLDQEELDLMYPGEVEVQNIEEDKTSNDSDLKLDLLKAESELAKINDEIADLVLNEIPSCEEYVDNATRSDELTEARHDLFCAKQRLDKAYEKKRNLEKLVNALKEKISRLDAKEEALYDEPEDFEKENLERELAEIERRLKSIFQEMEENDKLKSESKDHYQRIEFDQDNRDLNYEKFKLLKRMQEIQEELKNFGQSVR